MTPEELSRTSDDVFRERLEAAAKRAGAVAGRATGKACRVAMDLLMRIAYHVFPRHDTCTQRHAVPIAAYRILHALLPARDREVIERELEEQLKNDAENPLFRPAVCAVVLPLARDHKSDVVRLERILNSCATCRRNHPKAARSVRPLGHRRS